MPDEPWYQTDSDATERFAASHAEHYSGGMTVADYLADLDRRIGAGEDSDPDHPYSLTSMRDYLASFTDEQRQRIVSIELENACLI